jgi:DeoR/GlpR family transcriptional regulator of sugar metabolism
LLLGIRHSGFDFPRSKRKKRVVDSKVDLFAEERQELLLEVLRANGKVRVQDASTRFGVSPDTIRRDLNRLVRAGIAYRTHGGALIRAKTPHTIGEDRMVFDPKSRIGKKAASLVKRHSLILFDSGWTSVEVAKNVPAGLAFTAVTNNLGVAEILARRPETTVIVVSGRILKNSMSIVGGEVLRFLRSVRADLCFLGACSVGLEFGVGAIEADELPIKQQMIESSTTVIALASNEKFTAKAAFSVCPLSTVDTIITDQKPPKSLLERYQAFEVAALTP